LDSILNKVIVLAFSAYRRQPEGLNSNTLGAYFVS